MDVDALTAAATMARVAMRSGRARFEMGRTGPTCHPCLQLPERYVSSRHGGRRGESRDDSGWRGRRPSGVLWKPARRPGPIQASTVGRTRVGTGGLWRSYSASARWIHSLQDDVVLSRLVVSHVYGARLIVAYTRRESFIVISGPAVHLDAHVEGVGRRLDFEFTLDERALSGHAVDIRVKVLD